MKTELTVPSDLKFITIVEDWLLNSLQLELINYPHWLEKSYGLRLVLVEAFANVVCHAHKQQVEIPVLLQLEIINNNICLKIWDRGEGFDFANYSPPQPHQLQEGGYGWSIVESLMDKAQYYCLSKNLNYLQLEVSVSSLHQHSYNEC